MKKIKIEDLESKIGYKIKKNFVSFGCDTASTIGLAILKTDNKFIHFETMSLKFTSKNVKEKYSSLKTTVKNILNDDMFCVLENVYVGINARGAIELARYNGLVIGEFVDKGLEYEIISAISARSKFKIDTKAFPGDKNGTKKSIALWVKENTMVDFDDDNINDAIVLALCGICEDFNFEATTSKKAKRTK